jgi:hypothetical protein
MDGRYAVFAGAKNCRWRSFAFLVYPLSHEFYVVVIAARAKKSLKTLFFVYSLLPALP